jgi:hypothetical protein
MKSKTTLLCPDHGSGKNSSRIQGVKSTGSQIQDPDQQHWLQETDIFLTKTESFLIMFALFRVCKAILNAILIY